MPTEEPRKVAKTSGVDLALQESQERFRRMVEQSPLSVQILAPDGKTLQVNPAWEKLWGATLADLKDYNILQDEQLEQRGVLPIIRRAFDGETLHIPAIAYKPEFGAYAGQDRWSRAFIYPVKVDGVLREVVLIHEDITEKVTAEQALSESERRLRAIFDNAQDAILLTDDEGCYLGANPAAVALIGYTLEELEHMSVKDITPLEFQPEFGRQWQEFLQSGMQSGRYSVVKKNGGIAIVAFRAVANVLPNLHLTFLHDITNEVEAENDRKLSEDRFKELADSMPAIVWSSFADGEIDYLNRHYYEYTGLPTTISGPEGWDLVVHPEDRASAFGHYRDCLLRGEIWEHELRLLRHDGEYRWHLSRSLPVLGEDGKPVRWYATSTDIHDQKIAGAKARDEAFALETINQVGKTLSSELDMDTLVQSLTDAATALVGAQFGSFFYNVFNDTGESYVLYTLSGVPRSAFEKFPMPRNTAVFNPTFQGEGVVRSDNITEDPRYGLSAPYHGMPEGHLPVKSYLAVPVISRSAEVIGGLFFGHSEVGVFTDRHERMLLGIASQAAVAMDNARLYQRLTNMNVELEKRVKIRTAQLEAANQELEGFTYSVSHDLRGPLRAIMSTSMILQEDFAGSLSPEAIEHLTRQANAANRMGALIDDLLRLSRIGRQDMTTREVDLGELAKEVFDEMTAGKPNSPCEFVVEPNLIANVDKKLFRLVLWNFLDNAVKFSPKGGRIRFGASERNGSTVFFIEDQGIGFNQDYSEKVFLPFERLVLDSEFPGTGIGLANVKRIVERHGGTVWAEGALGRGTTFYFSIPEL
jgi:PAS domain S-box-containing protein